jgi:hypothetical protein
VGEDVLCESAAGVVRGDGDQSHQRPRA